MCTRHRTSLLSSGPLNPWYILPATEGVFVENEEQIARLRRANKKLNLGLSLSRECTLPFVS